MPKSRARKLDANLDLFAQKKNLIAASQNPQITTSPIYNKIPAAIMIHLFIKRHRRAA